MDYATQDMTFWDLFLSIRRKVGREKNNEEIERLGEELIRRIDRLNFNLFRFFTLAIPVALLVVCFFLV